MIVIILIFLFLITILSLNVYLSFKSSNDTIKVFAKIGFINFVIPYQKLIEKQRAKKAIEQRNDFYKMINRRKIIYYLCKHSSLSFLYMARFTKEELYINPFSNGFYLIFINQIKGYLSSIFKKIDEDKIELVYDNKYENIDYYVEVKTDVIGVIVSLVEFILKGR